MNRKQLIYVIGVVVIIILVFSYNKLYADGKNLILKGKKFSNEELAKGQYKGYNLIMISINNIGVEHMSLYGYKRKTTPKLDRWARDALVFENFFSHASWTLPVVTSLFTSLYPYTHKVIHRYKTNLLDKDIKTFPEILKESDYRTAAFTGGLDYYKVFGHMRGFEDIDDNPNFSGFDITLPQAKKWLSQNSDQKFFLFIHGYTAHPPFTPPKKFKGVFSNPKGKNITVDPNFRLRGWKDSENKYTAYYKSLVDPFAGTQPAKIGKAVKLPTEKEIVLTQDDIEYLKDLYDEEVLYTDSMVGDFLNSLDKKILDNTIIIIFSEHGEMLAKHGRFGRAGAIKGTLYDDVIHVPLLIRLPQKIKKRISGLAQIIDIMPTVLDILDISTTSTMQGHDLLPLINSDEPVNEYVYAGLPYYVGRLSRRPFDPGESINESIRDHRWKLIREIIFYDSNANNNKQLEEKFELYDIKDGPNELINLADRYPNIAKDLKEKLNGWVKWSKEFSTAHPSTQEIPEKLLQDAREHGYW